MTPNNFNSNTPPDANVSKKNWHGVHALSRILIIVFIILCAAVIAMLAFLLVVNKKYSLNTKTREIADINNAATGTQESAVDIAATITSTKKSQITAIDNIDSDSDGLLDKLEDQLGSNKNDPDTDKDGLSDGEEVANMWGTNLLKADTDGDGLNDYDEINKYKTNPVNPDTDGDGHADGQEVKNGYDPLGPGKLK